jgi:IS1 family transposase
MAQEPLSKAKRAMALSALMEGMAINSICRMFSMGKHSYFRFLAACAEACEAWHDKHFQSLSVAQVEIDEQWSYCYAHKERLTKEQLRENPGWGDCWLWAALDKRSKAIISWRTAKRTLAARHEFSADLAARIDGDVQITSDCLSGYRMAIPRAFGRRAHYATERKDFLSADWKPDANYLKKGVDRLRGVTRRRVSGNPKISEATVCHVERYFLTVRQSNKRCARKTLAYSKSWDNHAATASVHAFLYNLTRRHESLNMQTPAQALGITDKRWTAEMVVDMVDAFHKAKEEAAFENAFASKFSSAPTPPAIKKPKRTLEEREAAEAAYNLKHGFSDELP